jgi:hypothetical protein
VHTARHDQALVTHKTKLMAVKIPSDQLTILIFSIALLDASRLFSAISPVSVPSLQLPSATEFSLSVLMAA